MNILLFSMPDSFEHMPSIAIRMPNGGLTSLAGNLDPEHRVGVVDLILAQRHVRATVERLVREWNPPIVGLSVMTFQRKTAFKIIALIRSLQPDVKIVVGGYDPSLASEPYMVEGSGVDFIVRGEGSGLQFPLSTNVVARAAKCAKRGRLPAKSFVFCIEWMLVRVHSHEFNRVRCDTASRTAHGVQPIGFAGRWRCGSAISR